MLRHRVHFSPGARAVLAGHFAGRDVERAALDDLTSGGTRIVYTSLAPNDFGRRIRIYGRTCYGEAGLESSRHDTLFVFKCIGSTHPPPVDALTLDAGFELLPSRAASELDPVGSLFGATAPSGVPARESEQGGTDPRRRPAASDRLRAALARGGMELLSNLHPPPTEQALTLAALRKTWKQLVESARRRPSAATREDLILAGYMEPRKLDVAGLRTLRDYLETVFVSQALEQTAASTPERVVALAAELGRSSIASDSVRSLLWSAVASTLSPSELRAAVVSLGVACGALAADRDRPWWDAICNEVYARQNNGSTPQDAGFEELKKLLDAADESESSRGAALFDWAMAARTRPSRVPDGIAPSPTSSVTLAPEPIVPSIPDLDSRPLPAEFLRTVDSWTLRQRGMSRDDLDALRAETEEVRRHAMDLGAALHGVEALSRVPEFGRLLQSFLERRRLLLGEENATVWAEVLDKSRLAFGAACARLDPATVASVIERTPVPAGELAMAAELFDLRPLWQHLPRWWWDHLGDHEARTGPAAPLDDVARLERFCVPAARNLTRNVCAQLEDLEPELLGAVSQLRPPPRGTTADEHLVSELAKLSRTLGHARQKYERTLVRLLDAGTLGQQDFIDAAADLDELEQRLDPAPFEQLCEECASVDGVVALRRLIRAAERALEAFLAFYAQATPEDRSGITRDLSWKQLRSKMREFLDAAEPAPTIEADLSLHYADVGTTYIDDETKQREMVPDKPPLFFIESAEGARGTRQFGSVRLPVVLRTKRPRAVEVTFSVSEDKDRLRAAWPSTAGSPPRELTPRQKTIAEEDWYDDGGGSYSATVPLTLPIRRPDSSDTLAFTLTAQTADGVEIHQRFSWDRFVTEADPDDGRPILQLKWRTSEDPNLARAVPVGPQVHLREALQRIRSGNSLAVTAPRRFGKSSLVALLEQRLAEDADAASVTVRVDCNAAANKESRQLDHVRLWSLVSDELARKLSGAQLGMTFDALKPPLPTGEDFEAVRLLAAAKKKKSIVIFFDEAQRLFDTGSAYGDRFRTLIATHLADRPGCATVVFCFVGLTTMTSDRLGADLHPLLNPLSHEELTEEQITKVIRKVTGRERTIFTTRTARQRLAKSAWNLYALRTLITRIQRLVQQDQRLWATVEDVLNAEDKLLAELRGGQNPDALNTYIRDSLNAGSDASDFRPVRAFPVAAAYALALDANRVGKDASEATRRTLNEWSSTLFRDHLARPKFDEQGVTGHLAALADMRILDRVRDARGGLRFRSEFLRSYLVGQANTFLWEEWFRDVLLQAGTRSIRLPADEEREPLGEGSQARAFRFVRGDALLTARVRELRSDAEREAFLENLLLLEKVRGIHRGNRDGAQNVFKLVEVGLVDGHPRQAAVEIYDFIPGVDLRAKVGKLAAPLVVKIGAALARALLLVHEHDVLHRDIRPENVILQDHAPVPVLIDFGLACVRYAPGGTPLDDEFTAPEVKGQKPEWTAAADVYALAKTLHVLLPPMARRDDGAKALGEVLSSFLSVDRKRRESVARLASALDALSTQLDVRSREQAMRDRLLRVADDDPKRDEIAWLVETGCALQISGFSLGMYGTERERLCAAAYVVNQFAERCGESVASYAKRSSGRWPVPVEAIVKLRNEFTHPRSTHKSFEPNDVVEGARIVGSWYGSTRLGELTGALLAGLQP